MILSFDKRFPELILSGKKIHTIREDSHNRWKAGNVIHFATGLRTAEYEQFGQGTCMGVQEIEIEYTDSRGVVRFTIDGKYFGEWHRFRPELSVNPEGITELARNDGFEDVKAFLGWFKRDFRGRIIHWAIDNWRLTIDNLGFTNYTN